MGVQDEILKNKYPIDIVICPFENGKLHLKKELFEFSSHNAAIIAATSYKDIKYLILICQLYYLIVFYITIIA